MIALYHGAIAIGLAPFDDLRHIAVDLEHKLLPVAVLHPAHPHVLQRDDPLRHVLGRVLEVIQTTVVEDEPTPLPTFPASSLKRKFVETFVAFSRSSVLCFSCTGASGDAMTKVMMPALKKDDLVYKYQQTNKQTNNLTNRKLSVSYHF